MGKVFYFGDNFNLFIPNKIFLINELKKGNFPLWNPLILSGVPYVADLGIFPFYPGNFLFFFFSPLKALTYLAIFQVFLGGVFMLIYLKNLGFKNSQAILGAVIFMFSGTVISHIGNVSILNVIIWLPLILYFLDRLFRERKFSDLFLCSFFLLMSFLGGHLQFFYYNCLFLLLYLVFKIKAGLKLKASYGLILIVIFLGLSAFQSLPFLEYATRSTRPTRNFSYATDLSMKPIVLIRFVLAEVYGKLIKGYSWGPGAPMERGFADVTGYLGIIPLILIIYHLFLKKTKKNFFWLSTCLLFLLLALGKHTFLYYFFFRFFPFFSRFRNPPQLLYLYTFSGIVFSLYGLNHLLEQKANHKKLKLLLSFCLTIFIVFLLIYLWTRFEPKFLLKQLMISYRFILKKPFIWSAAYNKEKVSIILNLIIKNLLIIMAFISGFLSLILLLTKKVLAKNHVISGLLLIVFLDLLLFSKNSLYIASSSICDLPAEAVVFLNKNLSNNQRFLSASGIIPYTGLFNYWNQLMVRPPFGDSRVDEKETKDFKVFKKEIAVLPPNLGMNFNLPTTNGYSTIVLKNYAQLFDPQSKKQNINNINLDNFSDEKINLLAAAYLVVDKDLSQQQLSFSNWQLVFSGKFVKIYKNKKVLPRAFLLSEKGVEKKKIKSLQPNKVLIDLKAKNKGLLVLADNYYPGWEAYIDGKPVKISRYKETLRAVAINTGAEEITFLFKPKSFYLGLLISGLTSLLCLISLALSFASEMKKR